MENETGERKGTDRKGQSAEIGRETTKTDDAEAVYLQTSKFAAFIANFVAQRIVNN